jgi:hypothetical protein
MQPDHFPLPPQSVRDAKPVLLALSMEELAARESTSVNADIVASTAKGHWRKIDLSQR